MYSCLQVRPTQYWYIQQQSILHPKKPVHQLQCLSDTQWTCRFYAVDAICSTFDAILTTLQCIMDGSDKMKATEASGIFYRFTTLNS